MLTYAIYECCGCGACSDICPTRCIQMVKDPVENFFYPSVNREICIHCNRCTKVCPVRNVEGKTEVLQSCYVGYNTDSEIRRNSSSGAIFPLMAEHILSNGGYVYGAVFNESFTGVRHIGSNNPEIVQKMYGSKYIQSYTGYIFQDVKNKLEAGLLVLFSGTSCQINALNLYLGRNYDRLFTVDVICHGVASSRILEIIKKDIENRQKEKIKDISFRNKDSGWKKFLFKVTFSDGKDYKVKFSRSEF